MRENDTPAYGGSQQSNDHSGELFMPAASKTLPKGYMGRILNIDLTEQVSRSSALDFRTCDLFFGGRGIGVALLFEHFISLEQKGKYKNAFKEAHPLGEDNVLIFSTSPTTGTSMPASGRFHVNFKSPLTGGVGSANSGGKWAVAFKKTRYDILRITGKSPSPTYVAISPEGVEFKNAECLLQLNVDEITDLLSRNSPKGTRIMTIGEAGRRLSRIAAIMNDRGRALGRGGGGAVFGSKNLLAIVVHPGPAGAISVADPEGIRAGNERGAGYKARLKLDVGKMTRKEQAYGILSSMGTLGILGMVHHYHELVHNNMSDTRHRDEDIEKINGEALRSHAATTPSGKERIASKKSACYNCPIACTRVTGILDAKGDRVDQGEGPEFETVALLGANLSIYDLVVIARANYWANRYGLDTISLGGTIAAFIELYNLVRNKKKNRTTREEAFLEDVRQFCELYGEPQFGRKEILVPLVHTIGRSEGIGEALAEGSHRFCRKYGHEELSMSVKKMELPAYDPRTAFLQGLCYEMNNRGGCHLENGYTAIRDYCAGYAEWPGDRIEGTAIIARNAALTNTAIDIIGACAFASLSLSLDEFALLINAVTGLSHSAGTLERTAWRTLTLERTFNMRAGFTDNDDRLPDRFYSESLEIEGRSLICDRDSFNQMHREYYDAMGWDGNGYPTEETFRNLGLEYLLPNGFRVPGKAVAVSGT
jgi:aldehyde:ferredoxin oxidoreductase